MYMFRMKGNDRSMNAVLPSRWALPCTWRLMSATHLLFINHHGQNNHGDRVSPWPALDYPFVS
jgi:hypothetical protein